jgi:ABC-type multidrug transport system fused ATPase/permease subunit
MFSISYCRPALNFQFITLRLIGKAWLMRFSKLVSPSSPFMLGLGLLSKRDSRKLKLVVLLQVFLGGLDLIGVALIGILGALSITGVQSQEPGSRIGSILRVLNLENLSLQSQSTILGLLAGLFLVTKTILSVLFTKRALSFLAFRAADISKRLTHQLLLQPYLKIQERSTQEWLFAITGSVNSLIIGVMGSVVSMISDFSLIFVMLLGLFIVDPGTAFGSLVYFGLIAYVVHMRLGAKAHSLGIENSVLTVQNNELIVQSITSFREIYVRNRQGYYLSNIAKGRYSLAGIAGELNFMPYVSKYVLEGSIVVGGLLLASSQFLLQDAKQAFATLAIFLAAASRIAPALLRLQQGLLQIRTSSGGAIPALSLINDFSDTDLKKDLLPRDIDFEHEGFNGRIIFSEVCFKYPEKSSDVISKISFAVEPGEVLAIVGPSGSGKTTMVDLMIGLIKPDSGQVLVSGDKPSDAISKWPGAISYVPQDISISNDSIEGNICLGFDKNSQYLDWIKQLISASMLDEVIQDLENGIETNVGERGTKLSGGQRQRLGIARALFTNPKLIILDEATSALDAETEQFVSNSINGLRGKTTVVLIAHRLATVRNADKVCYVENGQIKGFGSFDQVRKAVPNFDHQANLLGLN